MVRSIIIAFYFFYLVNWSESFPIDYEKERSKISKVVNPITDPKEREESLLQMVIFERVKNEEFNQELISIKTEKELLEGLLKELVPMLCIRKKVEIYESLFAPELQDPQSVFQHPLFRTTNLVMDFHEAKWRIILTKTDDARIVRLNSLLTSTGISPDIFCQTIGSFFLSAPVNIHLPELTLTSYSRAEMDNILRTKYSINDDAKISCITDVLMEI